MRALIVGVRPELCWALPNLLARAGFACDVLTASEVLTRSAFADCVTLVPYQRLTVRRIAEHVASRPSGYDWVIVTEDNLLRDIAQSDLPDALKLKLLPVRSVADFSHLYSKINLVKIFERCGIPAPAFRVATCVADACAAAREIGFPVMLKVDASSGGEGVYACADEADITALAQRFTGEPLLVQKKIEGNEVDVSGIFRDGKLLHFSYAIFRKVQHAFGPSSLRDYLPVTEVDSAIHAELTKIGAALGADGFANVTCIEAEGRRYYFEADMRANAWVDYSSYLGDDPAAKIGRWFQGGSYLSDAPVAVGYARTAYVRMPYFLRMRWFELLFNRYGVWGFVHRQERRLALALLWEKFFGPVQRSLIAWGLQGYYRLRYWRHQSWSWLRHASYQSRCRVRYWFHQAWCWLRWHSMCLLRRIAGQLDELWRRHRKWVMLQSYMPIVYRYGRMLVAEQHLPYVKRLLARVGLYESSVDKLSAL